MDLHIFSLAESGALVSWLLFCTMLALPLLVASLNVNGTWLKFGLRKNYYQLVYPNSNDAFADQPNDLKRRREALSPLYNLFLWVNVVAGLCMLVLASVWAFKIHGHAVNSGQALFIGSRVLISLNYALNAFSILLICDWQSLNMRTGKRLKTMRELVNLVSLINDQAALADYHQPLCRALVKIADLPEQDFQSFWQRFNEHGELLGRLTVLQHVLQQDNLEQLLKENADLSTEVNKTIQTLLDTLINGLYVIEDVLQQAAEQNREHQSQRLLNEFKAVTDLRKREK